MTAPRWALPESFAAQLPEPVRLVPVPPRPGLPRLAPDQQRALRVGLGRVDMDLRWMALLDGTGRLRLWRSWTGNPIYQASVHPDGTVGDLLVEQDRGRYRGDLADEPATFAAILHVVFGHIADLQDRPDA